MESALQGLLECICDHIPVDFLSLHLFDPGLGIMDTAIDVTPGGALKPSRTILDRHANEAVREEIHTMGGKPGFEILADISTHPAGERIAGKFGINRAPCLILDLHHCGRYLGAITLLNLSDIPYSSAHGRLMLSLHDVLSLATRHYLRRRKIEELKTVIRHNDHHRVQNDCGDSRPDIVGADAGLKEVLKMVAQVAPMASPVLILGETGTGKEIVAQAIHSQSPRRRESFVKVNCGAIASQLIDSELFGHEKGAFTGAVRQHRGFFERAAGGTIFLDEIGELSLEAQTRLLRVVQENVIERVGGDRPVAVDIRILAATNRNLEEMVAASRFRQDLFFRLNVFPISLPPLRQRPADIAPLARHFVRKKARKMNITEIPEVADGAIDRLMGYHWPGNVRELENVVERELIIHQKGRIDFSTMTMGRRDRRGSGMTGTLDRVMTDHITRILHKTGGQVEGQGGAAGILGIHPRTLRHRMKKLGIPFGKKAGGIYSFGKT